MRAVTRREPYELRLRRFDSSPGDARFEGHEPDGDGSGLIHRDDEVRFLDGLQRRETFLDNAMRLASVRAIAPCAIPVWRNWQRTRLLIAGMRVRIPRPGLMIE